MNKTAPERAWIQINEIIGVVVALADRQASQNEVSVVTDLAPDLPPVLGDKIQLQQVILNLMLNGIEAMSGVNDRSRKLLIRSQMPRWRRSWAGFLNLSLRLDRKASGWGCPSAARSLKRMAAGYGPNRP